MGWASKKLREGLSACAFDGSHDDRWGALLIPRELVERDIRSRDRAFLLVRYTVVAGAFTMIFAPYFFFYLKLPYTLVANVVYACSLAITLLLLRRSRSLRVAANWTLASALLVLLFQCCALGGVTALAYPWLACIPMAAMLLRGVRGGAMWTAIAFVTVVGVGLTDAMDLLPGGPSLSGAALGATTVTIASLTLVVGALAWLAESRAEELLRDLQEQKKLFQERAVRDWLTGLANRSLLTECLIQSWERSRRHGPRGALFFIDLDDFKAVNDVHGHSAGDQVLREVALRLHDAVRSSDLVGRIGGDEFALIVQGVESRNDVAVLADKLAAAIEAPIPVRGAELRIGASIGVAFFPDKECHFGDRITLPNTSDDSPRTRGEVDRESVRRLLEKADAAMYEAKRRGLRHCVHDHVADETERRATGLVSEPPPAA
jgi:diguanylate cyclase (GGDEF)-like protein